MILCKEEKSKLRARMANRDDIRSGDEVGVSEHGVSENNLRIFPSTHFKTFRHRVRFQFRPRHELLSGSGTRALLGEHTKWNFKVIIRPSSRLRPVIFNNHSFRSTLRYQFNKQLSLRIIGEYDSVRPTQLN